MPYRVNHDGEILAETPEDAVALQRFIRDNIRKQELESMARLTERSSSPEPVAVEPDTMQGRMARGVREKAAAKIRVRFSQDGTPVTVSDLAAEINYGKHVVSKAILTMERAGEVKVCGHRNGRGSPAKIYKPTRMISVPENIDPERSDPDEYEEADIQL
jgi:hypothetical protein